MCGDFSRTNQWLCLLTLAVGVCMMVYRSRSDEPHFRRCHRRIPRGQTIPNYFINPDTRERHKDLQVRHVSTLSSDKSHDLSRD